MSFRLRASLFVLGGLLLLGHASCTASTTTSGTLSANCNALNNCCAMLDPSMTVGCQETAQTGGSDAYCLSQLHTYIEQGQCPGDAGLGDTGTGATDAAAD